jgi:hypothetical protein
MVAPPIEVESRDCIGTSGVGCKSRPQILQVCAGMRVTYRDTVAIWAFAVARLR